MKFRYLPLPVVLTYLADKRSQIFRAASLSLDFSGFTSMCDALLPLGRSGEETVASELEFLFTPMVETVESNGGFIADYAGDAFTALFPVGENISDANSVYLAQNAARKCLDWLAKNGVRSTPAGKFSISARAGVAFGDAELWIIEYVPEKGAAGIGRLGFHFCGNAIERCSRAQADALHSELKIFHGTPEAENCELPTPKKYPPLSDDDLRRFLPDIVVSQNIQSGEARHIVSVYGRFLRDLDEPTLVRTFAVLCEAEAAFEGYFSGFHFDHKGWGFLVLFGAPKAHEDNIHRALEFAFFTRRRLREVLEMDVQIGIDSGDAYVGLTGGAGRVKYTALGDVVNLSERISQIAMPGQILCSKSILKRAQKFDFDDFGKHTVKGKSEPVQVFNMVARKTFETGIPFEGKFCGRNDEILKLREFIEPIFSERKFSGVVRVSGIAGSGKSRLVYELHKKLASEGKNFHWVYLPCDPISRNPFNPLLYLLKALFPYTEFGDKDAWKHRFQMALEEFLKNPSISNENREEILRTISILGGYIGYRWEGSLYETLDAKGRKENFLYAMKSLIKANADIAPTIVELEDAHWLDAETESWLEILTRNVADVPFIIITTERPDSAGEAHKIKWGLGTNEQIFALENLTLDGLRELITAELGAPPSENLFDYLRQKTEGNPFFAEQFCQHFLDKHAVKEQDNKMQLIATPELLPPDAETMLVARIDAMGGRIKDMLQRASVLGVRFLIGILEKMMKPGVVISELLDEAVQHGAILADEIVKLSDIYYLFRHALLQEAAYGMQLPGARAKLHKLALEIYEMTYTEEMLKKPHYNDMCRHAEKAGDDKKFIEYLKKAADYAKETYQNEQALELYDKLLSQELEPKQKADAMIKKQSVLSFIGEKRKALQLCEQSLRIYRDIGDVKAEKNSLIFIGSIYINFGKYDKALEYYEFALIIARELDDVYSEGKIFNSIGIVYKNKNDYKQAMEYYDLSLSINRKLGNKSEIATTLNNIGNINYRRGDYDKAMEYYEESVRIEKKIGKKHSIARTINNIGLILLDKSEYDKAMEYYQSALEIWQEIGDRTGKAATLNNIGIIYFEQGDYDKAMEYYKFVHSICCEIGERRGEERTLHNIGSIYLIIGEYDKAMKYFEDSLLICNELGNKKGEAITIQAIGTIHAKKDDYEKAMKCFNKSLKIYREIGDKRGEGATLGNMGRTYISMENRTVGKEYLCNAIEIEKRIEDKYYRCSDLYSLAGALFDEGEIDEAEEKASEANTTAKELPRPDVIFESDILLLKIAHARGQTEEALNGLNEMLAKTEDEEQKATLHYELWKMMRDVGAGLAPAQEGRATARVAPTEPALDMDVRTRLPRPYKGTELPTDAEKHRITAIKLYEKLYEKTPKYEYKKKIEELDN